MQLIINAKDNVAEFKEDEQLFSEYEIKKMSAKNKIVELISKLQETDYQVLKWKEGELTDEQFEPIRLQRKAWREEIRSLGG